MADSKTGELMEKIVSLCKRRGFVFQSSEIYGGLNGFWDYGPLGAELKRNLKDRWWKSMTQLREDVVGLEASIIMHPRIWEASGHTTTFSDLMVDCLLTKKRYRADQIEPQSGVVHHFVGAVDSAGFEKFREDVLTQSQTLPQPSWTLDAKGFLESIEDVSTALTKGFIKLKATVGAAEVVEVLKRLGVASGCGFSTDAYAVLVQKGKPVESAVRTAREIYAKGSDSKPVVIWAGMAEVQASTRFNPENGAPLTEPRPFNLMLKTYVGPVESADNVAYLRPETAQAIFAQFKNVLEVSRQKVPFGIAQIGKAFRNEINPRNFTFRSREFEQMELEFFIRPDEAVEAIYGSVAKPAAPGHPGEPQPNWGWQIWHQYWVEERIRFYESIGLDRNSLVEYWQKPEELAHYARATVDILYKFPFSKRDEKGELTGEELEGIAARSDFDLSQHQRFAGKPMTVFDEELKAAWSKLAPEKQAELRERYVTARLKYLGKSGEPADKADAQSRQEGDLLTKGYYVPHVIEPSAGVDRLALALICSAYCEDQAPDDKGKLEGRLVMRFHPRIAPIKVAVFPLLKNKPELVRKAREVYELLRPHMTVFYDEAGAIGRRYRRQDEAGTPFGVTIDFETLGEQGPEVKDTVTLRDRDAMTQERVRISDLQMLLSTKLR